MTTKRWGGREAMNARAAWLPRVLAGGIACCRCGRPIVHRPEIKGGGWDVDHYPIPRELGGTQTWPAHANACNRAAGGRRGAQITNARRTKTVQRLDSERSRGIRGI